MTSQPSGDPPVRLLAAFFDNFPGQTPEHLLQAPERDMWGMATPRDGGRFTIVAPDLHDEVSVTVESARYGQSVVRRPVPAWASFPVSIIVTLAQMGLPLPGGDIAIVGEEPAGPRYTYALGLVVAALLYALAGRPCTADQLTGVVEQARRDLGPTL